VHAQDHHALKRVFGIEIGRCARCAGRLRIIAKILAHLEKTAPCAISSDGYHLISPVGYHLIS